MRAPRSSSKHSHYHIRWLRADVLDWESFPTHGEAQARAEELVLPQETYTIGECDESCARCRPQAKSAG